MWREQKKKSVQKQFCGTPPFRCCEVLQLALRIFRTHSPFHIDQNAECVSFYFSLFFCIHGRKKSVQKQFCGTLHFILTKKLSAPKPRIFAGRAFCHGHGHLGWGCGSIVTRHQVRSDGFHDVAVVLQDARPLRRRRRRVRIDLLRGQGLRCVVRG